MKLSVVSVMVIGLLGLGIISAAPVEQDDSGEEDIVDKFLNPLFKNMHGLLNIMKTGQELSPPQQNQETKFGNSEYTITKPIPDKDGKTDTAPSFFATSLQNLLKGFLNKDPKLSWLSAVATDRNLIQFMDEAFDAVDIEDMMKLARESPVAQNLFKMVTNELPLFGHLKDVIEKSSLQDRVLGEVLSGHKPSLSDVKAVADGHMHYSVDKLAEAIKQDKQFQNFLSMTLDKHPDVHDALKLMTGKDLNLDGNLAPRYQGKYSVTSKDIAENKEQVNLGTAVLFGAENFSPIMKIAGEFRKSHPNLSQIVSNVFKMDTSMLKPNNKLK